MERMNPHANVERILAAALDQVFVAANTSSFQSFRRQLLQLIRNQMDTQRKFVDKRPLPAQIVNTDFRICKSGWKSEQSITQYEQFDQSDFVAKTCTTSSSNYRAIGAHLELHGRNVTWDTAYSYSNGSYKAKGLTTQHTFTSRM